MSDRRDFEELFTSLKETTTNITQLERQLEEYRTVQIINPLKYTVCLPGILTILFLSGYAWWGWTLGGVAGTIAFLLISYGCPTLWQIRHPRKAWWMAHTGKRLVAAYEAEDAQLREQIEAIKPQPRLVCLPDPTPNKYWGEPYQRLVASWAVLVNSYPQYAPLLVLDPAATDWSWWYEDSPVLYTMYTLVDPALSVTQELLLRLAGKLQAEQVIMVDYPQLRVEAPFRVNSTGYVHIAAKVRRDPAFKPSLLIESNNPRYFQNNLAGSP